MNEHITHIVTDIPEPEHGCVPLFCMDSFSIPLRGAVFVDRGPSLYLARPPAAPRPPVAGASGLDPTRDIGRVQGAATWHNAKRMHGDHWVTVTRPPPLASADAPSRIVPLARRPAAASETDARVRCTLGGSCTPPASATGLQSNALRTLQRWPRLVPVPRPPFGL